MASGFAANFRSKILTKRKLGKDSFYKRVNLPKRGIKLKQKSNNRINRIDNLRKNDFDEMDDLVKEMQKFRIPNESRALN